MEASFQSVEVVLESQRLGGAEGTESISEAQIARANVPRDGVKSWKDICQGINALDRLILRPEEFDGKVKIQQTNGAEPPRISFDRTIMDRLASAWSLTVVFKPIGSRIRFDFMARRIKDALRITCKYRLVDLPNGYFLLKMQNTEDYDRIITGGPWSSFGCYLAFQPWSVDFDPQKDSITKTAVWVRIHKLPMVFYEEYTLQHIASGIGEPLKVDSKTLYVDRGCFARVCVNLDLSVSLPESIIVEGEDYALEYEKLNAICLTCGLFGHFRHQCPRESGVIKAREDGRAMHLPKEQIAQEPGVVPGAETHQKVWIRRWQGRRHWVQKVSSPEEDAAPMTALGPDNCGDPLVNGNRFSILAGDVSDDDEMAPRLHPRSDTVGPLALDDNLFAEGCAPAVSVLAQNGMASGDGDKAWQALDQIVQAEREDGEIVGDKEDDGPGEVVLTHGPAVFANFPFLGPAISVEGGVAEVCSPVKGEELKGDGDISISAGSDTEVQDKVNFLSDLGRHDFRASIEIGPSWPDGPVNGSCNPLINKVLFPTEAGLCGPNPPSSPMTRPSSNVEENHSGLKKGFLGPTTRAKTNSLRAAKLPDLLSASSSSDRVVARKSDTRPRSI